MGGNLDWPGRGVIQATNHRVFRDFGLKTQDKLSTTERRQDGNNRARADGRSWHLAILPINRTISCGGSGLSPQVSKKSTRICGRKAIYCRGFLPPA